VLGDNAWGLIVLLTFVVAIGLSIGLAIPLWPT
jgi:hypothetical protein